ncbi:MAG TPA: cytochrome c biogenesis protein CcdA [Acidimicrobiales bacterium]|nr:cytochrome c biogenesis protein CcdA [Acidimicrobiales bacterium]
MLLVGFVAGLVTVISPCVLPVLPVVFAGGTTGGRRRAVAIVAGLTITFAAATLLGVVVLSALGLPQDLLTDIGIALLLLLALGLTIEPIGALIERPFARLSVTPKVGAGTASGVLLGAGLGLGFAPCAGPILAAITVSASRHRITWSSAALTIAYAAGVAVPLLILALSSQRLAARWSVIRTHARAARQISGVFIGAMAILIATGALTSIQDTVPSLGLNALVSPSIQTQLNRISGEGANTFVATQGKSDAAKLPMEGTAPAFTGITAWLNTTKDAPLSLASLKGKVVLVDFWTYSCINCRRSIPHVESWYQRYHKDGFVVVGVSAPEFAFEHVVSNVAAGANSLGITYPVAVDDNLATWTAYRNNSWPAEYLIDQHGVVRHTSVGEGDYSTTEADIRALLVAGGVTKLPPPTDVPNETPTLPTTPESYLGYESSYYANNIDNTLVQNSMSAYTLPNPVPQDFVAYGGNWDVQDQEATAGTHAVLALEFLATDVYLVLGGNGTVAVSVNGAPATTIRVTGYPDLYTLYAGSGEASGLLRLTVSPGVRAYDFTFG